MDEQIEKRDGQDVIDSLSVLEAVVPTFHADLSRNFTELFPHVILALRSRFAIVRQSAARCFATICDVLTVDAMRYVLRVVHDTGLYMSDESQSKTRFSGGHCASRSDRICLTRRTRLVNVENEVITDTRGVIDNAFLSFFLLLGSSGIYTVFLLFFFLGLAPFWLQYLPQVLIHI